jgi:hypothetical protein
LPYKGRVEEMADDRLYTMREVCERLRVSRNWLTAFLREHP